VQDLKNFLSQTHFKNQAVTSLYCGTDILKDASLLSDCAPEDSMIIATITAKKGSANWYEESLNIPVSSTPCSIGTCILKKSQDNDNRFVLPCDHSICAFCLSQLIDETLNKGIYRFFCPQSTTTEKDGTKYCNKEISFTTIKESGLLGIERQKAVHKLIGKTLAMASGMKSCPKCNVFLQRADQTSAWVRHEKCNNNTYYDFCWWCLKDWKGASNNRFCGNAACTQHDPRLDILEKAKRINIRVDRTDGTKTADVPSMRACPCCFTLQERDNNGCRYTYCPCTKLFCFVCLSFANNHSSPLPCSADHWKSNCPVAPVQTKLTK
jgi:hypothetical protein